MSAVGVAQFASITTICMLVAQVAKATTIDNKWLPLICGLLGAGLGVASFFWMPGFPADNLITALAVGAASGLAGTGAHQTFQQLSQTTTQEVPSTATDEVAGINDEKE